MQLFKQIETLFRTGTAGGLTDGQLLERFVQHRDEAAFAALVDRHAAMVLRVCRQVLGDDHDAQDASQATFLVLACRAGSIGRRESVGCWLHGVALRVAAKARVAAARRRAHERRVAAMTAGRLIEELPTTEDRDRWTSLHEELGRLPETFRAPLVLCYLEGLTQEQAAARLDAPLGTIQSRLARGRAKLKARLERRGVDASLAIPGAAFGGPPSPAPAAWVEATVRMAVPFVQGTVRETAAAPVVGLAEEVLRAMLFGKVKVLVGMILFAAVLVTGVASWARQEPKKTPAPSRIAINPAPPDTKPQPTSPPQPEPERTVKRIVRGIVHDEQGRPVAGAWIGSRLRPMPDVWSLITLPERIRVATQPYRDQKGQLIPAGSLGRYFDYRDDSGTWQPVHPDDIRGYDPSRNLDLVLSSRQQAALEKLLPNGLLEIRMQKGRQRMMPLDLFEVKERSPGRTDSQGQFEVEVSFLLPRFRDHGIHLASADFLSEAVQIVQVDGPDRLVEITLRPTRPVRARLVETPKDHPGMPLHWRIYSGETGAYWPCGVDSSGGPESSNGPRRLEVRLPVGRYKVVLDSPTVDRTVDLTVPAGEGPGDLPDFHLESLAWVKMLGKPAAEIEAADLQGKPVKLADYRGKVVLLTFWGTQDFEWLARMDRLAAWHERLKDQPLTILALHDASVTSVDAFKAAAAPLLDRYFKPPGSPFRLLLDQPPASKGAGPIGQQVDETGSGRTSDRYEISQARDFVIDKEGRLVSAHFDYAEGGTTFAMSKDGELVWETEQFMASDLDKAGKTLAPGALLNALEDQFGLTKTPRPKSYPPMNPSAFRRRPDLARIPLIVTGEVVGLDGKPIAGGKVSSRFSFMVEQPVKTDVTGSFSFAVSLTGSQTPIKIEAAGLATRTFWADYRADGEAQEPESAAEWTIEPSGRFSKPLRMGPGVVVTGRVVRGGKPVPGATMRLSTHVTDQGKAKNSAVQFQKEIQFRTDDQGHFRIQHVAAGPDLNYAISAKPGSLEDHRTVIPRPFQAPVDGAIVDLGDFEARPGCKLAGRLILSDGKRPPPDLKLEIRSEDSASLYSKLDADGRFEMTGIPEGNVSVFIEREDQVGFGKVTVRDYVFSPRNKCLNPKFPLVLEGRVDRDITDLTILHEPGNIDDLISRSLRKIDPARLSRFNDAKAGPITGVPPGYDPKGP